MASRKAQGFDIGVRIGGNTPIFPANRSELNVSHSYSVGVVAGVQCDYWFNTTLALTGQILYVEKKVTVTFVFPGVSGASVPPRLTPSHSYTEFPLEVRIRFSSETSLRPYIYAGIAVGLSSSSDRVVSFSADEPVYSSTTDLGLIGGVGLDYIFPSGSFLFLDGGFRGSTTDNNSPINDLRFCVGILFPI